MLRLVEKSVLVTTQNKIVHICQMPHMQQREQVDMLICEDGSPT
jgi:hypothetical protein